MDELLINTGVKLEDCADPSFITPLQIDRQREARQALPQ